MVLFFPGSRKHLSGPKGTGSWCKGQAEGIEISDAALFLHPIPWHPRSLWWLHLPRQMAVSLLGSPPVTGTVLVWGEKRTTPKSRKGVQSKIQPASQSRLSQSHPNLFFGASYSAWWNLSFSLFSFPI